ncbi:hypothetical Protein YC6258_05529 [Gynuella sunshinyii YC6258]|uniref:Uncharacterized protein n=2 Tax=Gynuella sunshinyii TaxID=1445505 RepID=A0A0C5VSA5_9GAMM|nr:hypothetical Protein YC6258_05529 [Gynuella sunshinyii YC6258]
MGPLKNRNSFDAGEEAPLATPQFTDVNEDVRLGLTTSCAKIVHFSEAPYIQAGQNMFHLHEHITS